MYKVELSENETILKSKELKDYESAFSCLNGLIKYLGENRKIIIYEKKSNEWIKFNLKYLVLILDIFLFYKYLKNS